MTDDSFEMISALFDGEPVDPAALSTLLATPEARQTLADFALLRARVLADTETPRAGFARDVHARIARAARSGSTRTARLAVAAAVILTAFLSGLWFGERGPVSATVVPVVPDNTRVVKFVQGEDWLSVQ